MMELIPAIDLLDGRCVRLLHGDFERLTVYADDAGDLAQRYAGAGAPWLHVVDLAAARDGENADTGALFELLRTAKQSVQTGGGVRTAADIERRLSAGAKRVVIGSLCATEPERFAAWLQRFGADRLVAALDVQTDPRGEWVPRVYGWTEAAPHPLWSLLEKLNESGLLHLLCTDIGRDGAMAGPNLELYRAITARYPALRLQASGGVSSLDDLRALNSAGAAAAISGKALLEDRFTVAQALEALR